MSTVDQRASRDVDATPLCLALDGTVVWTDTLAESLVRLARLNPLLLLLVPVWLLGGRAHLKRRVAERAPIDPATLPYAEDVLAYAREQRARGRPLWLVTGADAAVAGAVAGHLGIFDGVLASDGRTSLTGVAKAQTLCERFPGGFDYAGDERADVPVWARARRCILVGVGAPVRRAVGARGTVEREFPRPTAGLRTRAKALRLHQWAKNVLVFLPLVGAHRVRDIPAVFETAIAFVAFGVVASAVYVVNDILDVESDRRHARKRHRAIASGELPLRRAVFLPPVLLAVGGVLASALPPAFGLLLAGYFGVTLAYSLDLKRRAVLDVLTLAALYTSRIFAGGLATGIPVTEWLASFSIFLFLSLAFLKRSTELLESTGTVPGRGYVPADRESVLAMGSASGYLSVLVLAFYVSAPEVRQLYPHPRVLWGLCPLVLYWITRLWFLARRGQVDDDPLVFAMRDRATYLVALLGAAVVLVAARP